MDLFVRVQLGRGSEIGKKQSFSAGSFKGELNLSLGKRSAIVIRVSRKSEVVYRVGLNILSEQEHVVGGVGLCSVQKKRIIG